MKIKFVRFLGLALLLGCCIPLLGQSSHKAHDLLPMEDVDQSISKIYAMVSNMGFQTHVDLSSDLKSYNGCEWDKTLGRLKMEVDWYNTGDETGKMIAEMVQGDNAKLMASFFSGHNNDYMEIDKAKEVKIKGGKMMVFSKQSACVNEITGPNGETKYFTSIRAYVFTGSLKMEISLYANTKADALEKTVMKILEKAESFDFGSLQN